MKINRFVPFSINNLQMKKTSDYAPYIFAAIITTLTVITNNLWVKPNIVVAGAVYYLLVLGLWTLNEKILRISDNPFLKWGSLVAGVSLYIFSIIGLDYYVFHFLMPFLGKSIITAFLGGFTILFISTFIIEGIKWTKAREQSKMENLTLQVENMEAQFNLLVQQVNPEFLYQP
jgi:hypothetical protein